MGPRSTRYITVGAVAVQAVGLDRGHAVSDELATAIARAVLIAAHVARAARIAARRS